MEARTTVGFRQRYLWRLVADSRGERLGHGAAAVCGGTAGNGRSCLIVNQALLFPPIAPVLV